MFKHCTAEQLSAQQSVGVPARLEHAAPLPAAYNRSGPPLRRPGPENPAAPLRLQQRPQRLCSALAISARYTSAQASASVSALWL